MIRVPPHSTHVWPDQIEIGVRCTACHCLRGSDDAALRCVEYDAAAERVPTDRLTEMGF